MLGRLKGSRSLCLFKIAWVQGPKDNNRKIRTTFSIEYCGKILVPNTKPGKHSTFTCICAAGTKLGTDQTSIDVYFLSFY